MPMIVNVQGAYVRSGPATTAPVVGTLAKGSVVNYTALQNGFSKIGTNPDRWISSLTLVAPTAPAIPTSGGTVSSSAVRELQGVLTAFAKATNNPALNPGSIDGIVGDRTINAVIVVAPMVPSIPSEMKAVIALLPIGLAFPEGRKKAVTVITANASHIAKAVAATAIYRAIKPIAATTPTLEITPLVVGIKPGMLPGGGGAYPLAPASTWAKTPVGIAVIAGGVLATIGVVVLVARSFRA
jgi:hypothetical protein